MKRQISNTHFLTWTLLAIFIMLLAPEKMFAGNDLMGEVRFEGRSNVEKTSGVWIDGQYVGYLKELKGSKKVMLLPGEHAIIVRQDGYQDFTQEVVVQPGETQLIRVAMAKAATGPMPTETALVKIEVHPARAAVFLDGLFVGHVGEFEGAGRGMKVGPGEHQIRIALPGYQTFETKINPIADQKVEIKTELARTDAPLTAPLVQGENSDSTSTKVAGSAVPATKP